jgi:hypothetical protein
MGKLRTIAYEKSGKELKGLAIPNDIAEFFPEVSFKYEVIKIGTRYGIFCESGCLFKPTKEEIENYAYT